MNNSLCPGVLSGLKHALRPERIPRPSRWSLKPRPKGYLCVVPKVSRVSSKGFSGVVKLRNYKIKRKKQGTLFGCVEDLSYLCRHYWTIDHRRCSNSEDGKVFGAKRADAFLCLSVVATSLDVSHHLVATICAHTMRILKAIIPMLFLALAFASCHRGERQTLRSALQMAYADPDSALTMLHTIDRRALPPAEKAYYALTY